MRVREESGRNFPQRLDISLPQTGIRPDTPIHVGPAVFGLLTNPRLLDAVEDMVGPEGGQPSVDEALKRGLERVARPPPSRLRGHAAMP